MDGGLQPGGSHILGVEGGFVSSILAQLGSLRVTRIESFRLFALPSAVMLVPPKELCQMDLYWEGLHEPHCNDRYIFL